MTEVMGVPVQQSDTFLDVGGHSLAALRIMERLRAQGVIVSLRDIYEAQSMEALEARSTVSSACNDTNGRHLARISERIATPYEEALWVASLLAGDGSYRLPVVIEFRGGIDRQVVLEAIATLLQRHPSFRLKLLEQDRLRIVYGNAAPHIDQMFLFDSDGSDRPDTRAWAMVRNLWAERLAPEEGKTVRAAWIQLEQYRAWFVLIGHHIALDGPSIDILEDELAALLRGTSLEPTSPVVPDGRSTYNVEDKYVPAWVNLESTVRVAVSPTSRETRMLSQLLPSELPRLVEQAAHSLRVTPFSVVLAAWGVVLGHIQSRPQVAIATPSDLRSYSEERMIAYKVNPIVIVVNSNDELSAANIVKAVHESTIIELSHRHTPYAHHLQSRRARGLTSSPVAAMLTFDRWNSRVIDNCSFRRLPTSLPCATFDLDLDVIEDDSGNWLLQLHGRALESEDDLEVYVEKFKCVLKEMAKHPERSIMRMPRPLGATGDAAGQVTKGAIFNYNDERLHTRLVSRMEAEADAGRLIVNDEYCSFKQLDLSSRRWLAVIRAAGIPSGAVLAVDLEPGFDQLAATIAIARHGSIILAMDHMWPSMRKNAVSAGAAAILAKSREYSNAISISAATLPVEGSVDCICSPDDGAYIIGTSGSNGCPKLIQISHKAIGNHFGWMRRVRPLKSEDRVLAWTTVSFDVGMWERFAPLAEGATVVMASGLAARDLVQIAELIVKNKITLFQITPTLLRVLLENPSLKEASWPIDVFCGGEFLDDELVARFRHVLPGSRLHNLYGPTETAIDALATFDVNKKGCDTLDEVVDNLEIRVVDEAGRSLGVGEVGELAIAGPSLADGYVRNPEATAARFRALTKDDPKRFYLTGDRARWESQNKLKLMGRADRQVKINGERFELEEIEIALLNGGSVREAVVAQQNGHLVAFVVPATRQTTATELAAYLRRLIPRTFVPTEWFLVEEIPRTSSGKVDRRSLFPSEASVHRPTITEVATSRQAEIAEVWREVLGNNCGIDQNFFDVGGNSLTLLRLRTRLKERLGAEFTIPELFELATINAQARRLETFFDNILPLTIPEDVLEASDNRRELIRRLAAQRED
ncbi:MAG: AMP-binding protein [Candidatus Sulfotelmatobacter sp.]